ncbi:MAG: YebC/PmpR family DNA-binding transcriptional regulator [Candidatus Hinthialibacter antarcticus]|nr:YebC/PmpR family DNA-binding transcriptional regulator [Candidatus Hinthialibacter antarcticus]
MSGHSKWSTIKHKKAKLDAARGKVFTKIIRELTTAARIGGGDLSSNPRLRTAVDAARSANMPKDNIDKAIKKGTGELPGVTYDEMTYEGYGPGGVAVFLEVLTDNKNRITAELRHMFSKFGGNLGESGSVAWIFERKGQVILEAEEGQTLNEDEIMETAIDAGAEDVEFDDGYCTVSTSVEDFNAVSEALREKGFNVTEANLTRIPSTTVALEGKNANTMLKLMDHLEDNDDLQNVYANFDIPEEIMAAMEA